MLRQPTRCQRHQIKPHCTALQRRSVGGQLGTRSPQAVALIEADSLERGFKRSDAVRHLKHFRRRFRRLILFRHCALG